MLSYIPISDGEDEPWSPTSIAFDLIAARHASLNSSSTICDLGAGGAVSSIAIARRTGALVNAVDSSPIAIASIVKRATMYEVIDQVSTIEMDVVRYLDRAAQSSQSFDLVLAEGGIAGAVGHEALLKRIAAVTRVNGVVVVSGYVYNGVSHQPIKGDQITVPIPQDVREHHEHTRHAKIRREILDEQALLCLIQACGFDVAFNCRAGQNHWSAYFDRICRMCRSQTDAALLYGSSERQSGSDEAFYNIRGQKYLSYAIIIATRRNSEAP